MFGRNLLSYFPVILLIIVAIHQIAILQPVHHYSRWKGGGFGVYCRPYEYFVMTFAEVAGKPYLVKVNDKPIMTWVNADEGDLNSYAEKYLNQTYLIDTKYSKGAITGAMKICTDAEAQFYSRRDTAHLPDNAVVYLTPQDIEKISVQLWERKLSDYHTLHSRLIKTIVREN